MTNSDQHISLYYYLLTRINNEFTFCDFLNWYRIITTINRIVFSIGSGDRKGHAIFPHTLFGQRFVANTVIEQPLTLIEQSWLSFLKVEVAKYFYHSKIAYK